MRREYVLCYSWSPLISALFFHVPYAIHSTADRKFDKNSVRHLGCLTRQKKTKRVEISTCNVECAEPT